MIDYKKQGRKNKRNGADFERKVRADLEAKNWIVSKWHNNVDLKHNKIKPASPSKFRLMQTGFPDFIVYKYLDYSVYLVNFVECKTNGYLSKEEREKGLWYLDNNYCSKFLIAKKNKVRNRIKIEYKKLK